MTDHDHHDHDHGADRYACAGLPPPPPDEELSRFAVAGRIFGAMQTGSMPHHWSTGPLDVTRLDAPRRVRLRDGTTRQVEWEFKWFLDRVEGTDRKTAIKRLYDVFLHPNGWTRAGVRWKRTLDRAQAHIVVRVIPQDTSVCGPGSAGCYSWGYEADGKAVAENGVEHIDRDGPWRVIVGMEVQGHGTFRVHDGYINHPGYEGVMGSWESVARFDFSPSEAEIQGAVMWLAGQTPAEMVHQH